MGQVQPDSGTLDIGETVRFGYYSQDGLQFAVTQLNDLGDILHNVNDFHLLVKL